MQSGRDGVQRGRGGAGREGQGLRGEDPNQNIYIFGQGLFSFLFFFLEAGTRDMKVRVRYRAKEISQK